VDTARSGVAPAYVLGERVAQVITPVQGHIARGPVDYAVDLVAVGPLLSQLVVVVALRVVVDGEVDRQSAARLPADKWRH